MAPMDGVWLISVFTYVVSCFPSKDTILQIIEIDISNYFKLYACKSAGFLKSSHI